MQTYDIHEAKAQFSMLIDEAVYDGEPFITAKAGKPLVKVVPLDAPAAAQQRRFGSLAGQLQIPADFDTMHSSEIADLFEGTEE